MNFLFVDETMTSKTRDVLKVAIFEGNAASLQEAVQSCCQSIGIAKTLGVLVGVWTAHYLSPDDASMTLGYAMWEAASDVETPARSKSKRDQHTARIVKLAQRMAALPLQTEIPSYNVHELYKLHNKECGDKALVKRYAVRAARPYVHEWLEAMAELKAGLDPEVQEKIWRLLNTLLSDPALSTLKKTLPSTCPMFSNHILTLLWSLLVAENASLAPLSALFVCQLTSQKQFDERLPLLYVTCLYRPMFVALFEQMYRPALDNDAVIDTGGRKKEESFDDSQCDYMWKWETVTRCGDTE